MKYSKPINILLVDDNVIIRKSFKQTLSNISNIKIVGECSDGREVIPFLQANEIDVVFMDVIMKFMDGFETTEIVKKHYSNIKVIGFSSSNYFSSISKMKKSGADGFISKFDATEELIIFELKKVMGDNY